MKKTVGILGLVAAVPLALQAQPAAAQVQSGSQELDVYVGALFGDDITDVRISGNDLELDDDVTFGARYRYYFTPQWGIEVSGGFSPNTVKGLPTGDVDLDLTTLDVDAVWNFNLSQDGRFGGYLLGGVGYAIADLDRNIVGTVNGQPVSIGDDDGFTLNAGLGFRYWATDQVVLSLEGRYRYLDKVVDAFDDSLNTVETTLAVGWRF